MHSFVIVAAKPGRTIPRSVIDRLDRPDDHGLPFVPEQHVHWTDHSSSIHFAGWQAFTDVLGVGSHWHVDHDGVVAFSGHPWPRGGSWTEGSSWASQMRGAMRSSGADGEGPFGGVYASVAIDDDGRGSIVTDPLSVAILYRAENDDVTVFANNARLAASTAGTPSRDPLGTAWLIHLGYIAGESTTFAGTTAVPPGAAVELSPRFGCRVSDRTGSPWSAPHRAALDVDSWIDLVHDDMRSGVRSIAALPTDQLLADLTGGRDSRLILALLVEQGLQDRFTFRTTGGAHTSDSQVGELLATELGLDHEPLRPQPMSGDDFENRLRTHVFQTSGMLNPWDFKGALAVSRRPRASGLLGELVRGTQQQIKGVETDAELWTAFRRSMQLDRPSILHRDVREALDAEIKSRLLDPVHAGGSSAQDRLDSFYIRNRLRRWVGTQEELGEACRMFPLYSAVGVQAAFALGADARRTELIPFEVMRRADEALAKLPLADTGWQEALISHLPGADAYRTEPVKALEGASKPVQWQRSRIDDNRQVVQDHLLDERANPIFDLVDREAILAILDGEPEKSSRPYQQIFGALSAAIWLGGDELGARYGDQSYEAAHQRDRAARPARIPQEPAVDEPDPPAGAGDPAGPAPTSDRPPPHPDPDSSTATATERGGRPNPPTGLRRLARMALLTTSRRAKDAADRFSS